MAKLSKIFASLNGEEDLVKQKYFAQKIVENFLLKEGKVAVAYDIEYIKEKIFIEAMKKSSLNESLKFVDGIDRQLDEGFFSALKDMGKAAWSGVKKVGKAIKDKIKGAWTGLKSVLSPEKATAIDKAIMQWNSEVSSLVARHTGSKPNVDQVKESYITDKNSYLFQSDRYIAEATASEMTQQLEDEIEDADKLNRAAPSTETTDTDVDTKSPEEENGKIVSILEKLATGTIVESKASGITGSGWDQFKFYKINKQGSAKILSFGIDSTTFIPMFSWNGKSLTVMVPNPPKADIWINKGIVTILGNIKVTSAFGYVNDKNDPAPTGVADTIGDIEAAASKIIIKTFKNPLGRIIKANKVAGNGENFKFGIGKLTMGAPNPADDPENAEEAPATSGTEAPATSGTEAPATSGTEAPAKPLSPKEEALALAKKNIDESIDSSGVKSNGDGFYTRMGLDPASVWDGFDKFAKRHAYNIVNILDDASKYNPAGKTAQHPAELQPLEYIAVLANMTSFINNLAADYTKTDTNLYNFLSAVGRASSTMNKVVDRETLIANTPSGSTSSPTGRVEPTAAPAQPVVKDELVDEDTFNKMKL